MNYPNNLTEQYLTRGLDFIRVARDECLNRGKRDRIKKLIIEIEEIKKVLDI